MTFTERQRDFRPQLEPLGWDLPLRMEPFLAWLDTAYPQLDDEAALAEFLKLPVATAMPSTLKDDLRRAGLLVEV